MNRVRTATTALVTASAAGLAFWVSASGAGAAQQATTATTAATRLSASEQAGLSFSREEERMARELYRLFADKYAAAPFARISASEQRHFQAVGAVLARYGIADPSAGAKAGVYADATLQKLYDGWKASGLSSVTAADRVGIALEKRDIADLQRLQKATGNADLDRLYSNLENGSEHHLAAFTAAASGTALPGAGPGGPRHQRSGNGNGAGNGMGPGHGAGRHAHHNGMGPGMATGPGNRTAPGNGTGTCPFA